MCGEELKERAQARESAVLAANRLRHEPLKDARLVAGNVAQRRLDELKESVENSSRKYPELRTAFKFLLDACAAPREARAPGRMIGRVRAVLRPIAGRSTADAGRGLRVTARNC